MDRAIIYDRHGNPIEVDDDVIRDGCVLRVPVPFLDAAVSAALHQAFGDSAFAAGPAPLHDGMGHAAGYEPGFAFAGPVPRTTSARQAYIDALSRAWRHPPEVKPVTVSDLRKEPPKPDHDHRVWKTYVNNLSTAWKNP
jgi:hypothetical protein